MKKFTKLLGIVLIMALVMSISVSAFAAASIYSGAYSNAEGATNTAWSGTGPASITITLPTQQVAPTGTTTYEIYKVFDATSAGGTSTAIAYQLIDGKTAPVTATDNLSKFDVDTAGNIHFYSRSSASADWALDTTTTELSAGMIAAIASYVSSTPVCTAVVPTGDTSVTVAGLEYGYYYIGTSTGTAVTVDSTNPNASVQDKNVIPPVVKSAGTQYDAASLKAIAAVGTSQSFTAQITKTHGAVNLVFTDTMTNMTYNGDVAITVSAGTAPTAAQALVDTTATGFTVTFDNDYIAGLADGTTITLKYSGKITSDALSVNPATNKATLTSGDGNTSTSEEVKVYNAKFTVSKEDGNKQPLAGAGFVIKNSEGKYYKLNAATAAVADDPDTPENEAVAATTASITWYALETNETLAQAIEAGKVTEYKSDSTGAVQAFTGLADGTYTLVESTTPAGYNTAADYSFTIKGNDYTTANLEQSTTVVNKSGTELPSTGGIGTTIFYVVGSIMVVAAGVLLVTKKRMGREG